MGSARPCFLQCLRGLSCEHEQCLHKGRTSRCNVCNWYMNFLLFCTCRFLCVEKNKLLPWLVNQAEPASLEGLGAVDLSLSACFPYSFPLNSKQDSHNVNCPITGSHEFFINHYRSNLMSVSISPKSSELVLHTLLSSLHGRAGTPLKKRFEISWWNFLVDY